MCWLTSWTHSLNFVSLTTTPSSAPFCGPIAIWPLSNSHTFSMLEVAQAEETPKSSAVAVATASSSERDARMRRAGRDVLSVWLFGIALINGVPASFFHASRAVRLLGCFEFRRLLGVWGLFAGG